MLDSDGSFLLSTSIRNVEGVVEALKSPEGQQHVVNVESTSNGETVSIRVSGFMANEGIT